MADLWASPQIHVVSVPHEAVEALLAAAAGADLATAPRAKRF